MSLAAAEEMQFVMRLLCQVFFTESLKFFFYPTARLYILTKNLFSSLCVYAYKFVDPNMKFVNTLTLTPVLSLFYIAMINEQIQLCSKLYFSTPQQH